MDSYQCRIFGQTLPRTVKTVTLYDLDQMDDVDIPPHITNLHIECVVPDELRKFPSSITYLKVFLCSHSYDFSLLVSRAMTLVICRIHRERIEQLKCGPDFRVEYI